MELKGAEIFAVGDWNDRIFTAADLDAMVTSFEALDLAGRVPLKFGHADASDDQPALGWVSRLWREGQKLLADFTDIPKQVYDALKAGLYKFVSVELLRDTQAGTRLIPWTLDAVALLGATPPAVGTLKDLQSLTMARRPALRFAERCSFTRNGDDDQAALRAQIAALQVQLLRQQQDTDVRTGRCLPSERHRFDKRYRDAASTTIEHWNDWIKDVPRPAINRPGGPAGRAATDDAPQDVEGLEPDAAMVVLTKAEIEKSGGRLSYMEANRIVMRREPGLTERYRLMPGVTDR